MTASGLPDPETFRPHIGAGFTIDAGGQPVVLTLVNVVDEGVSNGMHQFSLFFHGPGDQVLPDRIYTLTNPSFGAIEIFITPIVGSNQARTVYQACFSQPAGGAPNF